MSTLVNSQKGMIKTCKICGEKFTPDKYHPNHQEICSNLQCQHQRQILNQKKWRVKNPSYFRYSERKDFWEQRRYEYLKRWRENHRGYFMKYRADNQRV